MIASSVTAFSRETIKKVITFLESKQCNIIYGDTDSVFFTIPETHFSEIDSLYSHDKQLHYSESIKKSIEFTKQITPVVNSFMEQETRFPFMKMAYEKVLHPSLFLYKKQY
ncbi:3831_t:CDS:1, partial [Dentiscutata erythropus]